MVQVRLHPPALCDTGGVVQAADDDGVSAWQVGFNG